MASVSGFRPVDVRALTDDMAEGYYRQNSGDIKAMMRAEAPYDTGLLRASHSADPPKKVAGGYLLRFRAEIFYAVYQHQGYGPIVPRVAKALRWVDKAGVVVFAQRVRAQPANPWMYRAFVRLGLRGPRHVRD
jgi:hypothetical protein